MFAAINPTRPWPPSGLTSRSWLHQPITTVHLGDLTATQDGVYLAPLLAEQTRPVGGDPLPHVIAWGGQLFLEDGHHRAVRAALNGRHRIPVRVLTTAGRP